eukprot:9003307-Pyramimonas_sp.AAC.1
MAAELIPHKLKLPSMGSPTDHPPAGWGQYKDSAGTVRYIDSAVLGQCSIVRPRRVGVGTHARDDEIRLIVFKVH